VSNLLSFERMMKNLTEILGGGKAHLLKTNKDAFQAGYDFVKKELKKC
jgi:hypothetical protein